MMKRAFVSDAPPVRPTASIGLLGSVGAVVGSIQGAHFVNNPGNGPGYDSNPGDGGGGGGWGGGQDGSYTLPSPGGSPSTGHGPYNNDTSTTYMTFPGLGAHNNPDGDNPPCPHCPKKKN